MLYVGILPQEHYLGGRLQCIVVYGALGSCSGAGNVVPGRGTMCRGTMCMGTMCMGTMCMGTMCMACDVHGNDVHGLHWTRETHDLPCDRTLPEGGLGLAKLG